MNTHNRVFLLTDYVHTQITENLSSEIVGLMASTASIVSCKTCGNKVSKYLFHNHFYLLNN